MCEILRMEQQYCVAPLRCHLYDFYRSERFCARNDFNFSSCQLTEPPRFIVIRVLDQSVEPRSRSRTIAYPSDSKVRSVYTGIWTSLMTVITLGSTLQLHVSSGSCASVILRSGVTHRGGQDRVLLVFSVDPKPRISRSPSNSIRSIFCRQIQIENSHTPTYLSNLLPYIRLVWYRRIALL